MHRAGWQPTLISFNWLMRHGLAWPICAPSKTARIWARGVAQSQCICLPCMSLSFLGLTHLCICEAAAM
jgi:hypothetical protein